MIKHSTNHAQQPPYLIRIPDAGVTEQLVVFADQAVLAQVQPGEQTLDIGCGRGIFSEKMAAKGAQITAIDILLDEIEAAQSRPSTVDYRCMAAEDLGKLDAQFTLIVSRFCFHHLEFPEAAESIRKCLAPKGRLYIVDCYRNFWSLRGRLYVLWSGFRRLGTATFFRTLLKSGYFFAPNRFAHVRSDIQRLRKQKRYTLDEVRAFYQAHFPDCTIDALGCAFTISWQKPS